jgi:hypothetical protein
VFSSRVLFGNQSRTAAVSQGELQRVAAGCLVKMQNVLVDSQGHIFAFWNETLIATSS